MRNHIDPPKKTKENVIQEKSTDSDTEIKAIDGEDFGPVGAVNESDTETRKNVNSDPNIIQGNKLDKKEIEK